MMVGLALVVAVLLVSARRRGLDDELGAEVVEFLRTREHGPRPEIVRALASLVFMLGGAALMVRSAVSLAGRLGLAEGFTGLTLVGIGTSAPLIASSIQAARRGEHDLVVGNVLGGNLFIALGGGAIVGLLSRGDVRGVGALPLWLMAGVVFVSWLAMARGGSPRPLGSDRPPARICDHAALRQPLMTGGRGSAGWPRRCVLTCRTGGTLCHTCNNERENVGADRRTNSGTKTASELRTRGSTWSRLPAYPSRS
jgi:hypothetical protein